MAIVQKQFICRLVPSSCAHNSFNLVQRYHLHWWYYVCIMWLCSLQSWASWDCLEWGRNWLGKNLILSMCAWLISCTQCGHHKGSAGTVLTTVSLSPCGKACATLVQRGSSDEGFIRQVEKMSALAHRELSRSYPCGDGSLLLSDSFGKGILSLGCELSTTCTYCPASVNVLCIYSVQGASFMESRVSTNLWGGLILVAVLPPWQEGCMWEGHTQLFDFC